MTIIEKNLLTSEIERKKHISTLRLPANLITTKVLIRKSGSVRKTKWRKKIKKKSENVR